MTSLTLPTFGYHLIIGVVLPYLDTGRGEVFVLLRFPYMLRFLCLLAFALTFSSLGVCLVRQVHFNTS